MLKRKMLTVFPSLILKPLIFRNHRKTVCSVYKQIEHSCLVLFLTTISADRSHINALWKLVGTVFIRNIKQLMVPRAPFSPAGINAGCGSCRLARACWQWKTLGLKTGVAPLVFSSADLFGIS